MKQLFAVARPLLLAALLAALPACLAVAAGAGAAGAIAWTQRGASSLVQGSVDDVFQRSVAVFQAMNIERTGESTEDSGAVRRLVGTRGDLEVTVEMERDTPSTTRVEVYARESAVEWDREFARDVLSRIIDEE